MTNKLTKPKYAPPLEMTHGLWPVIYGSQGIVLGHCESQEEAQRTANALNKQAPQWDHRVGDPT